VLCNGADGTATPVVNAIWVTGLPAAPGGSVVAHVSAVGTGTLTYAWSTNAGWTITDGQTTADATIRAPATPNANGAVTVTVTDGLDQTATGVATVATAGSDLPMVQAVVIDPQPVVTSASLVVAATDAGGQPLTASWRIGGVEVATGLSAQWTNPGVPGYYDGSVTVTDADANSITWTFALVVDSESAWPAQGRTLQSTERVDNPTAAATGSSVAWTYAGPGMQNAPVLDRAGNVYVGSWDQGSEGFAASVTPAGTERWVQPMTTGSTCCSDIFPAPIVANDMVYWSTWSGLLWAGDLATGAAVWTYPSGDYNDNSSPIVGADGTIYFGSAEPNAIFAIHPDGSLKWQFDTADWVANDLAIAPNGGVVFVSEDRLYVVDPDGSERWSRVLGAPGAAGGLQYGNLAIGRDGTIYVPDDTNDTVEAYASDGALLWRTDVGGRPRGTSLGRDETVYIINSSCELVALWRSGIERWRYTTGTSSCWTTPAIGSDGTIYFVDGSGGVRAVNPDGTEKWNSAGLLAGRTSGQIAIGADGTLYASDNATLYAIE
jgi:outer membrane protein assembly factor BamB